MTSDKRLAAAKQYAAAVLEQIRRNPIEECRLFGMRLIVVDLPGDSPFMACLVGANTEGPGITVVRATLTDEDAGTDG